MRASDKYVTQRFSEILAREFPYLGHAQSVEHAVYILNHREPETRDEREERQQ